MGARDRKTVRHLRAGAARIGGLVVAMLRAKVRTIFVNTKRKREAWEASRSGLLALGRELTSWPQGRARSSLDP